MVQSIRVSIVVEYLFIFLITVIGVWGFGVLSFQQYFRYIWRLVLLVEETGVPEENHRYAASH